MDSLLEKERAPAVLLFENIILALNGLRANKMRSLLTMLGIIIGIASVIAINTVGNSMTTSIQDSMSSMGATNVTLGVSQKSSSTEKSSSGMTFNFGPHRTEMTDDDYLTDSILDDLQEKWPDDIEGIETTESVGTGIVEDGDSYANVSITGVNDVAFTNEDLTILAGRTFTERDYEQGKKVALVSDYFCNNLYNGDTSSVIGQQITVTLNNKFYHYTVVGVYEYDADSNFSSSSEYEVATSLYLPLQTAFDSEHEDAKYSSVTLVTSTSTDVDAFMDEIEEYVNGRYYRNNDNFEVSCSSMSTMLESMTSMLSTISIAISIIAGISLLVGGIGVMNIMLVSIQERTREIGTRKALGARNASIRTQFIVESMVLCLVGGLIGVILGIVIGAVAAHQMGYDASPSTGGIIFAITFSMAIGIFFGYYPANKAAKMNPIDALRYE